MTQYYLWFFPEAGKCSVKSIGLHHPHTVFYKKEGESNAEFKTRCIIEFDELFDSWFAQVAPEFRNAEIISTKTLQ